MIESAATRADRARVLQLALLGDTFAIHEVGEHIAAQDVLPVLASLPSAADLRHLVLTIAPDECLPASLRAQGSTEALMPIVSSAVHAVRESLSDSRTALDAHSLAASSVPLDNLPPWTPRALHLVLTPFVEVSSLPVVPSLPAGARLVLCHALSPGGAPATDAAIAQTVIERSRSGDLLSTQGLIAFLRRNHDVVLDLAVGTARQIADAFPSAANEGLLTP